MTFQLIVPTIAETQLTGFAGGIEKTFRGSIYRVEFHPAGLSCTKDGMKVRRWDDLPKPVQKAVREGRAMLQQGHEMAQA